MDVQGQFTEKSIFGEKNGEWNRKVKFYGAFKFLSLR